MKGITIGIIIIFIVVGPILTNILIQVHIPIKFEYLIPFGEQKDWLTFFGNYSGGIIGGLSAYVIAKMQIDGSQREIKRKHIKNQIGVLNVIKLDLMIIKAAFEEFEKKKNANSNFKGSVGPNLVLSYDIWAKVGLISNENIQTDLYQAQNFYKLCIDGLNKNINNAEKTLEQIEKTIRLINVNVTDIETNLRLSELLITRDKLTEEINIYNKQRKAAWNLIKHKNYIKVLSDLEVAIDDYLEELQNNRA